MTTQPSPADIAEHKQATARVKQLHEGKTPLACVITLGCVQNENDSDRLRGMLKDMGYQMCSDVKTADVVLFNTCAVRDNAEQKVLGYVGALKHEKEKRPDLLIGICGCMMQQPHMAEQIRDQYKHVDMVFGTHSLHRFPQILYSAMHQRVVDVEQTDGYVMEGIPHLRTQIVCATVSVMYGCNNFCSYCVVPYVRGRERSRKASDIVAEVQGLAAQGCKEVTLLGQNVNSYGSDCGEIDFADLLGLVSKVDGIERIRFVSAHPKDVTEKLIDTMAQNPKVCNQLHIPFQSGSTNVLKDMNRCYTKEQYLDLVRRVKERIPNVALSGDVIVGFPTETQEDFAHTLDVVKQVQFDMLFTFLYSKRKGTPAETMTPVLTQEQIKHNFDQLVQTQTALLGEKNKALMGTVQPVLVEGTSKTNEQMLTGRNEGGKIIHFPGDPGLIGTIVPVEITHTATWSLTGKVQSNLQQEKGE